MKYTGKKEQIRYVRDDASKAQSSISDTKAISRHELLEKMDEQDRRNNTDGESSSCRKQDNADAEKNTEQKQNKRPVRPDGNSKKKKSNKLKVIGIAAFVLSILFSGVLIYLLYSLKMLPDRYLILLGGALGVLIIITGVLQFSPVRKLKLPGRIISIVLAVMLLVIDCFGAYAITRGNNVIKNVTGEASSIDIFKVVVLADDPAETLADAKDYTFGTAASLSGSKFDNVIEQINEKTGQAEGESIKTENYTKFSMLYDSLFNGDCGAIIYNESFEQNFIDMDEDYLSKIKVLEEIKIVEKTKEADNVAKADVKKECYTIFISGNDQYDEVSTTGRSDVNILCVINPNDHQIMLVSIPRDYYVKFPGVTGDERDKLTHSGIYGIDVQLDTIENIFSLDEIDYYVKINFSSLIEIVDAIGGVDVDNPYAFGVYQNDDFWFDEGLIHLDGEEALWYSRERKTIPGGDLGRGEHQMIVIQSLINQLCSASSVTHFDALMDALDGCAITNMPDSDIRAIIQDQLDTGSSWSIIKVQAQGVDVYQPSYAAGGDFLSVCMPYVESVEYLTGLIQDVLNGKVLDEDEVADNYPEGQSFYAELIGDDSDVSYDNYSDDSDTYSDDTVYSEPDTYDYGPGDDENYSDLEPGDESYGDQGYSDVDYDEAGNSGDDYSEDGNIEEGNGADDYSEDGNSGDDYSDGGNSGDDYSDGAYDAGDNDAGGYEDPGAGGDMGPDSEENVSEF